MTYFGQFVTAFSHILSVFCIIFRSMDDTVWMLAPCDKHLTRHCAATSKQALVVAMADKSVWCTAGVLITVTAFSIEGHTISGFDSSLCLKEWNCVSWKKHQVIIIYKKHLDFQIAIIWSCRMNKVFIETFLSVPRIM